MLISTSSGLNLEWIGLGCLLLLPSRKPLLLMSEQRIFLCLRYLLAAVSSINPLRSTLLHFVRLSWPNKGVLTIGLAAQLLRWKDKVLRARYRVNSGTQNSFYSECLQRSFFLCFSRVLEGEKNQILLFLISPIRWKLLSRLEEQMLMLEA